MVSKTREESFRDVKLGISQGISKVAARILKANMSVQEVVELIGMLMREVVALQK